MLQVGVRGHLDYYDINVHIIKYEPLDGQTTHRLSCVCVCVRVRACVCVCVQI